MPNVFRSRKLQAVLALSVLVCAGLTSAGNAEASPAGSNAQLRSAAASLPDSATIAGPVIASGRLLSPKGAALVGATVLLAVDPSNERLAAMKQGQSYLMRFVARATVSSTGSWMLRLPAAADLTGSVSEAGDVNFTVLSMGAGWVASTEVAATGVRAAQAGAVGANAVGPAIAGHRWVLPAGAGAVGQSIRAIAARADATRADATRPAATAGPLACVVADSSDLGSRLVTVGEGFSDAASVTTSFSYLSGQSSTLGAAISSSGGSTGWSASGTVGVSKSGSGSTTSGFPSYSGAVNHAFRTTFDYRKYHIVCPTGAPYYQAKAVSWAGGAGNYTLGDVAMGYCAGYQAGSFFEIDSSTATTISAGATLSAVIGINLSSRTGYSTSAKLRYTMGSTGHPVCGKNANLGSTPGLVMVHSSVWTP